jgi:hypothetical protein
LLEIIRIQEVSGRITFPLLVFFRNFLFNPASLSQEGLISLIRRLISESIFNQNYFCRKIALEIIRNNSFLHISRSFGTLPGSQGHTPFDCSEYQRYFRNSQALKSLEYTSPFLNQFFVLEKYLECHLATHQSIQYYCQKYLKAFAPLPFRQLVSNYFGKWLINSKPESTLNILIYARFCLVDDDSDIREIFLLNWESYRNIPTSGFIGSLKSIYSELSSLPNCDQNEFFDSVIVNRLRNVVAAFQSEINSTKLFSFEPFNYFENLELEFLILKEMGFNFSIPSDISDYYEINKKNFSENNVFSNYFKIFAS